MDIPSGLGPQQMRTKTSMALFFMKAAFRFYHQTKTFEEKHSYPNEDYNAGIIGGIISSASFIECYINEIFTEISEDEFQPYFFKAIPLDKQTLIRKMWNRNIPRTARYNPLEKYDISLDLIGCDGFPKGSYPYQDASLLLEIRNELVHFEPRWTTFDEKGKTPTSQHRFEPKLKGKFEPSKLHEMTYFLFPHYCFSSSCLKWTFETSKDMALSLNKRANIQTFVESIDWRDVQ